MAASSSSSNGEQQYSLRWNDFHSSILSSFRHLRDEEDFVDVTLACDSSSFTAHKVVLSACSPYFRKLLKANPCQHPIVILRDVASSDMESLLRFMYHGEVHVGQEQLAAFLKTAQMLQVRGLADVKSSPAGSKLPTSQSRSRDNGESPITSRNTWHDRGDPSDSGLSPPPEKRSKSYSPPIGNHLELKGDLQDSLLGQALEGGPTIHTTPNNNIQTQSTGEDSNSVSDNDEDMSNNDSILNSVKAEPNDSILNDSLEHHRNSFPAALLGLQGLMPGPSGIHAANQDPNYDDEHDRLEDAAATASISHHHRVVIKVEDDDDDDDDEENSSTMMKTTEASTTPMTMVKSLSTLAVKSHRYNNAYSSRGESIREHHRERDFDCPLCLKKFIGIVDMRAHLDRHYPRDSPICPVYSCQKIFSHPNSVRNHMRLKHSVQWDKIKALRWSYV